MQIFASRLFRRNFRGFYFRRMPDALTTPLPVDATSSERLLRFRWYFVQYEANSSLQQPFRGQTDCREPSRSHGHSTYARNDIVNFHLSSFFLIYAEAGLSAKIAKICTQRKFPAIRYFTRYNAMNQHYTKSPFFISFSRNHTIDFCACASG